MALLDVGTGYPYSTIQAAVNAAPSGGTVRANANGGNSYPEAILINNKRIRLHGGVGNQGIALPGAGGGASPTVQVTGTGGVMIENFAISNVGSANAYVVQMNVAEDWITRCKVTTAGKTCLYAQYVEECLLYGASRGLLPSCPGQVIARHVTCVNMSFAGLQGNTNNGDFKACLAYNCNTQPFLNGFAQYCAWNVAGDGYPGVSPGALSQIMTLADIGFVNYAGGDFSLGPNSRAFVPGVDFRRIDLLGERRLRVGPNTRIYAGCYDPWPVAPSWATGGSSVRVITP